MKILPITEKDIDAVIKLDESFSDGWNKSMLLSGLNNGLKIFGVFDDTLKGYISYEKYTDYADIEIVLVKTEERKKGYGGELISFVLSKLDEDNIGKIFLEVRKSNLPAISLYEKFGFVLINERKKYYPDGENALVFLRSKY